MTMTYEDAHRNVTNLVSQFASLVEMLPTLEKAKDAEKFLSESSDKITRLTTTIENLESFVAKHQQDAQKASAYLDDLRAKAAAQRDEISQLQSVTIKTHEELSADVEAKKTTLYNEIADLVSEKEKVRVELQTLKAAVQAARQEQQSLKDHIKRANAALSPSS
jgi:chromosome segregation ATPase